MSSQELYCVSIPFNGYIEFSADKLTIDEFLKTHGDSFKAVNYAELNELFDAHYSSQITNPVEINEDRFNDMLEILPPCRWSKYGVYEAFHVSERLSGRLVSWFAHNPYKNKFYTFVDNDDSTNEEITQKLKKI